MGFTSDNLIRSLFINISQKGLQCGKISMYVGERCDPHGNSVSLTGGEKCLLLLIFSMVI